MGFIYQSNVIQLKRRHNGNAMNGHGHDDNGVTVKRVQRDIDVSVMGDNGYAIDGVRGSVVGGGGGGVGNRRFVGAVCYDVVGIGRRRHDVGVTGTMAKRAPGTIDTVTIGDVVYVGLRQWARMNKLDKNDERFVCRMARKTDDAGNTLLPGARQIFRGSWVIPVDTPLSVIPDHAISRARADGRIRFVVYLTETEYNDIRQKYDVIDLRVVRKTRRAAKRATKTG